MANTVRIKRRAVGGAAGAPASLQNAELAFNEQDRTLYYGFGTGGAGGSATSIIPIAGDGSFVALTGAQSIDGVKTFLQTILGSINGNAGTATKLQTARSISASGDATWTISFDGSANATAALTLASVGTAGTYTKVTTDAKGRVTAGTTLAATDIPTLTAAKISDFDTQVRLSRLDQMALPTAAVAFNAQRITGLADPTSAQDAATKNYVDLAVQGLDPKQSVKAATTANITLSGAQTIDGIALVAGDRALVKNQTTTSQNGIYIVSASTWARATDMDVWADVPNAFVFVEQGTAQGDTSWVCSSDSGGTIGSTAIAWFQFGSAAAYTAGNGLQLSGNTFSAMIEGTSLSVSASGLRINASWTGQNTITTLGTLTTGTWNASTIGVAYGGTGATTLTGYVKGNGTGAMTASASIPSTDISGLGTMAVQSAASVAITGGSISNLTTFDGVTIDGGTY